MSLMARTVVSEKILSVPRQDLHAIAEILLQSRLLRMVSSACVGGHGPWVARRGIEGL